MKLSKAISISLILVFMSLSVKSAVENNPSNLDKKDILYVMTNVANWQIDNFHLVKHPAQDWTNAALYIGMMEWAKIANDQKYLDWLYAIGNQFEWQPFNRLYHADDISISQMFLEMYTLRTEDSRRYRILGPTQARLDYVIAHPSSGSLLLNYDDPQTLERWSWCDALFMAPPVYTKMARILKDDKYLAFMDKEFKVTYHFLFDKDANLFYRDHRYFPELTLEKNGEKIFWGRGNGWVMGGLVAILKDLPKDSKYSAFYKELYLAMASVIPNYQDEAGLWHASLLDPTSFPHPETSSSSFFCYALAAGINMGLLDRKTYTPIVTKAWEALVNMVNSEGKLGWVQPIGQDPKEVTSEMTEVYGVGAFLLAGTEIFKLID
ncbi:MAG: glycoside hydrolase family 88 protein [Flammeovirgaceae bacterium]|jgi:unsaturated rhamnogalacturonyl hydrolase|nr:glycoside hydrolase family 88 protein [Flammeovirgaceae bacterium]|tara:strand:+ start:26507 stop:27643 length:1137 start_codon:yes stop_codon:yes gene_type:complete